MTTAPASETNTLRIQLLGGFQVTVGARAVGEADWQRRKAASLVKLLALAPSHRLHCEHLLETLGPDPDPGAAANNLHRTLHFARRALDPAATYRSSYHDREGEMV